MSRSPLLWSACIAAALLAGCEEEPLRTYNAPKEPVAKLAARPPESSAMSPLPRRGAPSKAPEWTAPAHWKRASDGESGMRFATYRIAGQDGTAELTVVAMPGLEQDLLANVNRWRGQLKLPETTIDDLQPQPGAIKIGGDDGAVATLVDIQGPETIDGALANPRQRMLAAMIPHGEHTWYFKLTGPFALLGAEQKNFGSFINSIRFVQNKDASPPATQPSVADAPASGGSLIKRYKAPADWRPGDAGTMRLLSFQTGPQDATAEITVVALPGDGGGALDNINRWRGQVGLSPVESVQRQKVDTLAVGENIAVVVDLEGPEAQPTKAQRMLVALMVHGDRAWFFKMMGARKTVGDQRKAFEAFVQSIEFGG